MNMTLLSLLSFLSLSGAWAGNPVSVTVARSGLDSSAMSAHDRFEITYDGLARWETSGFGETIPGCPSQGGSFQGRVSPEDATAIARLARESLASQKHPAGTDRPLAPGPRKVANSIWVDLDGTVDSGDVTAWSPGYERLTKAIDELETSLRPSALVVMRAFRSKNRVRVVFELAGDRPLIVLIPDKPMETFKIGDALLEYEKPHKEDTQLDLTPRNRTGEIVLKLADGAVKPSSVLTYSDAVNLHHGKGDALEGNLMPPELSLCATLESGSPRKQKH